MPIFTHCALDSRIFDLSYVYLTPGFVFHAPAKSHQNSYLTFHMWKLISSDFTCFSYFCLWLVDWMPCSFISLKYHLVTMDLNLRLKLGFKLGLFQETRILCTSSLDNMKHLLRWNTWNTHLYFMKYVLCHFIRFRVKHRWISAF